MIELFFNKYIIIYYIIFIFKLIKSSAVMNIKDSKIKNLKLNR